MNELIVLASKSPRRKELLAKITNNFIVEEANIVEDYDSKIKIVKIPETIALKKAKEVQKRYQDNIILAADTIVVYENNILGKPKDEKEAYDMLKMLSNHVHQVITGVCILYKNKQILFHSVSKVSFYPLSDEEIYDYIKTKSPFDKAGGYGIQDNAALFIKKLDGDYYNVMGLPIAKLNRYLKKII